MKNESLLLFCGIIYLLQCNISNIHNTLSPMIPIPFLRIHQEEICIKATSKERLGRYMNKKVNWGILGAAGIAKDQVIPAILEADNAKLYAIASRDITKLEDLKHFGFNAYYVSYEALLADPNVDAIYLPLPNGLHKEWAIKAMIAKKHVLCEKPLALSAAQVAQMQQVAEEQGVLLMEAFAYLHSPAVKALHDVIPSGEIGFIKHIHSCFSFYMEGNDNVRLDPKLGGGAIYDLGCYTMSLARYLLEDEPEYTKLLATMSNGVDNDVTYIARFLKGAKMTSYVSFGAAYHTNAIIWGEKGHIEADFRFNQAGDLRFHVYKDGACKTYSMPTRNNYTLEVEQFGRAILQGQALGISPCFSYNNAKALDLLLKKL